MTDQVSEASVDSICDLRRRYDLERRRQVFDALPRLDDNGLRIGRGTRLARIGIGDLRCFDEDADRLLVLLSAVHKRPMSPPVLKHARRAAEHWQRRDAALAHIELAFARLPRLQDEDDAFRLFLAEALLEDGMTPRGLARGLGLDMLKYDPDQPRVPAGNGRASGQFGSISSGVNEALVGASAAARAAEASFLADVTPALVRALATFAARFSVPTAVLGALFIPTSNNGGVTEGVLPDAPGVRFRRDGPAGTLRLAATAVDGPDIVVGAQNRGGVYIDLGTGKPIGRDLGERLYLDVTAVDAAFEAASKVKGVEKPVLFYKPAEDDPKICPDPEPDTPHPSKERALDYEDDVHRRTNPDAPMPRGSAVRILDPETGEWQYPDDCFRTHGDLVDGDMKAGDFVSAKGPGYEEMFAKPYGEKVMDEIVDQTKRYVRAAEARGAVVKVYFAEKGAADLVRTKFSRYRELKDVIVSFLPPSRRR